MVEQQQSGYVVSHLILIRFFVRIHFFNVIKNGKFQNNKLLQIVLKKKNVNGNQFCDCWCCRLLYYFSILLSKKYFITISQKKNVIREMRESPDWFLTFPPLCCCLIINSWWHQLGPSHSSATTVTATNRWSGAETIWNFEEEKKKIKKTNKTNKWNKKNKQILLDIYKQFEKKKEEEQQLWLVFQVTILWNLWSYWEENF